MPRKTADPAPRPPIGRHRDLLANAEVRGWYEGRLLRSRLSADTYLRQLGLFVERLDLDANAMVEMARLEPDRLRGLLTQLAADQKRSGLLDSYISKSFGGLRSWFEFRHVPFDGYPKLAVVKGQSLTAERVPTPEELGRVLDRLSPRGRVTALLMAHSGLRPGAIGGYGAEDGLRLQDLKELKLGKRPQFSKTPFVIRVPASLSKTRVDYTTFGTAQLASALLAYLGQRRDRGEKLLGSSPVVAPAETRGVARKSQEASEYGDGFLTTKAVVEEIRAALQATTPEGVTWRPYVLRAYCSTRLMLAEGSGKITRDLREAILGHEGGVAARYNVGKRWGDDLLNEARAAYQRCEPFLSTSGVGSSDSRLDDLLRIIGEKAGIPKEQVASKTQNELADAVIQLLRDQRKASPEPAPQVHHQRAVLSGEVDLLLQQGWRFVSPLGPDRAVLEPPVSPSAGSQ